MTVKQQQKRQNKNKLPAKAEKMETQMPGNKHAMGVARC